MLDQKVAQGMQETKDHWDRKVIKDPRARMVLLDPRDLQETPTHLV